MDNQKSHKKSWKVFGYFLWAGLLFYLCAMSMQIYNKLAITVNSTEFTKNAVVLQNEDKVGANIWLKQEIHGTDGINYRYVIETDCPSWDFETRYMTTKPIDWIDETSAVEVIIYDTQIRYDDTVYASGQYYMVPILGGISSENISLDDWQENLIKQAYQTYESEISSQKMEIFIYCVFLIIVITASILYIIKSKRK